MRCIASGDFANVWLAEKADNEMSAYGKRRDAKSVREHRRLERYIQRFADLGPASLDDQRFKNLGRFAGIGGVKVTVYEFKSFQFRLYGVIGEYDGMRSFVGIDCDPSKKKDKADQNLLQRVAKAADGVFKDDA